MKKIISQINKILSQKLLLNPSDVCICGLSGGQDSVLLFIILLHLKKQWNIKIQLLHFHHFWQERNFFSSQQVWKLAFIFQDPLYIIIAESLLNNEKKAREWRQQGLERISSIEKCNKILTGHTASDRIETGFWHLIRGTSPQGLISLKWQKNLISQTLFFNFPLFINRNFVKKILFKEYFTFQKNDVFLDQSKAFCSKKNKKYFYKKSNNKKQTKNVFHLNYSIKKKISLNLVPFSEINKQYQEKRQEFILNKKRKNFSFFLFNYYFLNSSFLKKNQQIKYTLLFFSFIFSKKNIIRPLLVFHRNDVIYFSKKYSIPIISDPSNEKLCWSRNRIRHQLFPVLKFFFNPNFEYLINNFFEISIEEQKYIDYLVEKILNYWLNKKSIYYNIENQIEKLPKATQNRLIQKIFQSYTNFQPNLIQIEFLKTTIDKNEIQP